MKIERIRTLAGPNVYSHRPVLVMRLDLEDLTGTESYEVAGFTERLLGLLPGLHEHHCAKGREGGFVERLYGGTYFGHVVEHVALELMELAGVPTRHGKTREAGAPGVYHVAVEYRAEQGTRFLLRAAVELVEALVGGRAYPLEERLKEARTLIARTELGPSTRAIVEAAERRGIPWHRIGEGSLVQFGYGRNRKFIEAAMAHHTSAVAVDIAGDKDLTKTILEQAAIPVPKGRIVYSEEEALAALKELGEPVVVKPLDGRQGKGVSLNLSTPGEVLQAFHIAREYSSAVLVEELLTGKNYRVLVVDGQMVAASERLPCHVVGDGTHSIAELVETANHDPLRGEGHEKPLTQIVVDEIMEAYLSKSGLCLEYVPRKGETVFLRESINLSTGGTARDVTASVHPTVARMCERAARVVNLDICGIDLVLDDIAAPAPRSGGGIIEVNAAPGLRMHLFPSEGARRDVGEAIVRMLYPEGETGRIPIISVTGTNGKTTVTRMIAHVIGATGATVGLTTTDGIYVGGECVEEGDTTGPHSARAVLSDPSVEVAVLETARGGITRRGLGYDWSDVAVLTNIQPDHIGQDGIETLEDLVYIKSLVAERVRDGGTLILNADDERLARLMEIPRVAEGEKRVVYFSMRHNHLLIHRHVEAGGTAYVVRGGWVCELAGGREERMLEVSSVPATMGGAAAFQVANLLAAVAACRAHSVPHAQIAAAMRAFRSQTSNPGRTALYRVAGGGHVLIDYGHNPEAFEAVCRMASQWKGRRVTGIVGVPGDRGDSLIREAGRVAARGFSRVVIKEDKDLRGRAPGEVARLLCQAVGETAPGRECSIVLDDGEALREELRRMRPDDIVVMFYERLKPVLEILDEYGAVAVSSLDALETRPSEERPAGVVAVAEAQRAAEQRRTRTAAVAARGNASGAAGGARSYVWR